MKVALRYKENNKRRYKTIYCVKSIAEAISKSHVQDKTGIYQTRKYPDKIEHRRIMNTRFECIGYKPYEAAA